jgi:hypothetical protein
MTSTLPPYVLVFALAGRTAMHRDSLVSGEVFRKADCPEPTPLPKWLEPERTDRFREVAESG